MKPESNSSTSPAASLPLSGNDPVLDHLKLRGLPPTRENYVKAAGLADPLEAEQEALVMEALSSTKMET